MTSYLRSLFGGSSMSVSKETLHNEDNRDFLGEELATKTKYNTLFMDFTGETFRAKVVHVYDGDTIHVVFKVFGEFFKWNCRINGVDTPEIRTLNKEEKKLGIHVRDELKRLILDKIVIIHCESFDKYGRLLIDIEMPLDVLEPRFNNIPLMLSEWLIQNKYAYAYRGGKKRMWSEILEQNKDETKNKSKFEDIKLNESDETEDEDELKIEYRLY